MIKITTDSTCDLSAKLLEKHNVSVIPLGIVKGERLYRDGLDIRPADIAAHVDAGGDITMTNAVNIADYETLFREQIEKYDAIIHLNIGSGFSSCYQNAKLAAEEIPEVYVFDSENLSIGHGALVLAAAEAAEEGKSVGEILDLLENLADRVEMSFVLDRLDYMKKGGRCSSVAALGANLLKLHPSIEVVDGKMSVTKKYRGSTEKAVTDYIRERLEGRTDLDFSRIIVIETNEDDHLTAIARAYLEQDGRFREIIEVKAGCTIFSHCGPNVLGLMILKA
jgi:DegV family protein with EDD domain